MQPPPQKKNKFIQNTICSLYEVEYFLRNYNTFSDALHVLKIVNRHNNRPPPLPPLNRK